MTYPMIGKRYHVVFPTMSFYLHFVSDKVLEFIVEKSLDLPTGSAHTVDITNEHLRDELYLVAWQEENGNTVVHLKDFKEHRVHAFLTMNGMKFIRQNAPLIEVSASDVERSTMTTQPKEVT